jgi:hypothetical protein
VDIVIVPKAKFFFFDEIPKFAKFIFKTNFVQVFTFKNYNQKEAKSASGIGTFLQKTFPQKLGMITPTEMLGDERIN